MKKLFLIALAGFMLLEVGCSEKASQEDKRDKSPAFMFGCFRKEIVSSTFHVPDMNTTAAATYLQTSMRGIPGYDGSSYDLDKRTLTVRYQSSTIRKMNFEEAIAKSGFSVDNRPAYPNPKIPKGVKK